jgi:hypothetical protein
MAVGAEEEGTQFWTAMSRLGRVRENGRVCMEDGTESNCTCTSLAL